jgi:hypothetical protein
MDCFVSQHLTPLQHPSGALLAPTRTRASGPMRSVAVQPRSGVIGKPGTAVPGGLPGKEASPVRDGTRVRGKNAGLGIRPLWVCTGAFDSADGFVFANPPAPLRMTESWHLVLCHSWESTYGELCSPGQRRGTVPKRLVAFQPRSGVTGKPGTPVPGKLRKYGESRQGRHSCTWWEFLAWGQAAFPQ